MKDKLKIELIFPLIVILLSSIELFQQLTITNPHYPALVISIIGIMGSVLYFFKIKFYKTVFYLWIIFQFIVITNSQFDENLGVIVKNHIWVTSPIIKIKIGLSFTLHNGNKIYLNIVPLFLFGLLRILNVSELVGKELTFKKFRKDNKLGNIFPLTGKIVKRVTLSNEKDWLLVTLNNSFVFRNEQINQVFIKAKEEKPLKKDVKGQLAFFRLIPENIELDENQKLNKKDFKFIDWVLVK